MKIWDGIKLLRKSLVMLNISIISPEVVVGFGGWRRQKSADRRLRDWPGYGGAGGGEQRPGLPEE